MSAGRGGGQSGFKSTSTKGHQRQCHHPRMGTKLVVPPVLRSKLESDGPIGKWALQLQTSFQALDQAVSYLVQAHLSLLSPMRRLELSSRGPGSALSCPGQKSEGLHRGV